MASASANASSISAVSSSSLMPPILPRRRRRAICRPRPRPARRTPARGERSASGWNGLDVTAAIRSRRRTPRSMPAAAGARHLLGARQHTGRVGHDQRGAPALPEQALEQRPGERAGDLGHRALPHLARPPRPRSRPRARDGRRRGASLAAGRAHRAPAAAAAVGRRRRRRARRRPPARRRRPARARPCPAARARPRAGAARRPAAAQRAQRLVELVEPGRPRHDHGLAAARCDDDDVARGRAERQLAHHWGLTPKLPRS